MKVKIITSSEELEQFTSRKDIIISKVDIKPCDQNFFAQEWFVAVVMYEDNTGDNFDWQSFRAEAAKDILSNALIPYAMKEFTEETINIEYWTDRAIEWTDSLISKLKEKEGI